MIDLNQDAVIDRNKTRQHNNRRTVRQPPVYNLSRMKEIRTWRVGRTSSRVLCGLGALTPSAWF